MRIEIPGLEPIIQPTDRRMPVELTDAEIEALRDAPVGQDALHVEHPRLKPDATLTAFLLDMQAAFQQMANWGQNPRSLGVADFKLGYFGPNTDASYPAVNVGLSVAFVHGITGKLLVIAMAPPPGWPVNRWALNAVGSLLRLAEK